MQWLLFTDKNFLNFVVLKVLQDGKINYYCCLHNNKRKKVDHVGCDPIGVGCIVPGSLC